MLLVISFVLRNKRHNDIVAIRVAALATEVMAALVQQLVDLLAMALDHVLDHILDDDEILIKNFQQVKLRIAVFKCAVIAHFSQYNRINDF